MINLEVHLVYSVFTLNNKSISALTTMSLWSKILIAILIIVSTAGLYLLMTIRTIEVETLHPDLHILRGVGSNTTVLKTSEGTVIVDSMTFPMQGALIRKKAEALTGQPVKLIINTHYHLDHTHGNPAFDASTKVISTARTLAHLNALDADFWDGERAQLLPNETFEDQLDLVMGDKTLVLKNIGRGHTDGDLVVLIKEHDTLVMGDLYFNQHYPNIDLEAGGSVQEWPATLDKALAMEFKTVIPGHGATSNELGLRGFQQFIGQLAKIGQAAEVDGLSLEQVLQSKDLNADSEFSEMTRGGIPIGLTREFVLRRAWEETTGNFERKN